MITLTRSEFKQRFKKFLRGTALDVVNALKKRCPVDKGLLRESIRYRLEGNIIVISMLDYAVYVEFGCFFDKNTRIKTKKGNIKLCKLRIGDLVWTGKKYTPIIQKETLEIGYPLRRITIILKNKKLIVTEDHPIKTVNGWKRAGELNDNDEVFIEDGTTKR